MSSENKDATKQDQGNLNNSAHNANNSGNCTNNSKPTNSNQSRSTNGGKPPKKAKRQDPFWYAQDEAAIRNMASFPWNAITGSTIRGTSADSIPGLITFRFYPTIGSTAGLPDAGENVMGSYVTRAAQAYFNYVTQGFTGGVNFEAVDLLFTALAANSLIAAIDELKRVYTLLDYYLQYNKYYAKRIVEALGFEYNDLVINKANLRTRINIFINQVNKTIAVPKGFFIGDRWEFLASALFSDMDNPEYGTIYAYTHAGYLLYDATTSNQGTCLRWYSGTKSGVVGYTVNDYFSLLNTLLAALNDDDVREMFGALRRVYTNEQLKQVAQMEEGIPAPILRNDVVDAMVHNANWANSEIIGYLPSSNATDGADHTNVAAYQEVTSQEVKTNICINATAKAYTAFCNTNSANAGADVLLDMYDHLVTPGNVLDITSNIAVMPTNATSFTTTVAGSSVTYWGISCRTEMIAYCQIWKMNSSIYVSKLINISSINTNSIEMFAALSHMDSHPLVAVIPSGTATSIPIAWFGEIDRYTTLSRSDVANMHDRSLFRLLSMPENTKSVTK